MNNALIVLIILLSCVILVLIENNRCPRCRRRFKKADHSQWCGTRKSKNPEDIAFWQRIDAGKKYPTSSKK